MFRVIAHDRFAHHGSRSGYVQVLRHLAAAEVRMIHLPLPPNGMRAAFEWWKSRAATEGAAAELHVYPEQTLFPRRDGPPVVAICHQPVEQYLRRTPRSLLSRLALSRAAGLVALGPVQARRLGVLNPAVDFVPHGVDVEWFSPAEDATDQRLYLAVRGWLRDGAEQARLLALARRRGRAVLEVGAGAPRMSDVEYRAALRRAAAVLLCISDGVASNAVLEAAACGKPVLGRLSPDLQSYVSAANRDLLAHPPQEQLTASADELERAGRENREHVLAHHDWSAVARRLVTVMARRASREAPITPNGASGSSPARMDA